MDKKLDPYLIELESRIQILELENETLSAMAEENLLLNRAFEDINNIDNIENLFHHTLEGISILLNIPFVGLFENINDHFTCIDSYALFSNTDTIHINFAVSENRFLQIELEKPCILYKSDNSFTFNYPGSDFVANEVILVALKSEAIKNRFFVFVSDENGTDLATRVNVFEKVVKIISAKLNRIFYQTELEKLNAELEQKVTDRTKELFKQNQEYLSLNEEYKTTNEELIIAKEKAEESEKQFRSLFDNAADAIFIADAESGIIANANKAAANLLKLPIDSLIGLHQRELHPPEVNNFSESTFRKQKKEIEEMNFANPVETRVLCFDGTEIPVEVLASKVFYRGSECIMGIFRDITERKRAEVALKRSEAEWRNLFESANDAIIIFEPESEIILQANQKASEIYGFSKEELIGMSLKTRTKDVAKGEKQIKQTLDVGRYVNFETQQFNKDGDPVIFLINATAIDYDGRKAILSINRDITQRKRIEEELIKAKEKAEESDRLKTAFLQNMSHEIRTPLNAIMGFSSLLSKYFNDKEKLEDFSKIIEKRGNDLLNIINDVLDISKIESGQSALNIENCNVNELFEELNLFFNEYKKKINRQGIVLQFHAMADESLYFVKTDKHKLKQILINLVSNALKFTEKGSVACGYSLENNKLQFYVSDTGIGIPADKHEFIFERFSRIETIISEKLVGGTGLGLSIVKRLVKLLGGHVWLQSDSGKGSAFYFTIDYLQAGTTHSSNLKQEAKQGIITDKAILIVEDDLYNAEYLKEILNTVSSNILTVNNGLAALKLVKEQQIDIILMDIRLPDISGYEASRMILDVNPDMKIIAQTAYAADTESQKALEAGCIDYISKPIKEEQLLTIIRKYLI